MSAKWIWLDGEKYPQFQKCYFSIEATDKTSHDPVHPFNYCVCEFKKNYSFAAVPEKIELRVSGDAIFRLWANGEFVGMGPASAGGDFLCRKPMLNWFYANKYEICPQGTGLDFFALVRIGPKAITEYSQMQGGFYLEGKAYFADGSVEEFGTDESWQIRRNPAYTDYYSFDGRLAPCPWEAAVFNGDSRELTDARLLPLAVEDIYPQIDAQREIEIKTGDVIDLPFKMVYSAHLKMACRGECDLHIDFYEDEPVYKAFEDMVLTDGDTYTALCMHSIGGARITVNSAAPGTVISPSLKFVHYPMLYNGHVITSDPDLNKVFDICKWTLGICRQTIHLDSPMHQELLACTGDYYIETLMTLFTYGDLSLAREDVVKTALWLCQNKGRMFHTTYSLIWVQMIKLVWRYLDDNSLLTECREAMNKLFDLFETYIGESGLIENPPDYMFVDWMVTDGYTLHHPPRYLGQTVLNAFWYKALCDGAELANVMGWEEGEKWAVRAKTVPAAFDKAFYDEEKGIYCEGIDDTDENRKSFARYGNILAAAYGLCDEERAKRLIRLCADDGTELKPIQPYFMNWLMQAAENRGMLPELGMKLVYKWVPYVANLDKGLQEGWYTPEDGYVFDHSHAWGGYPAYFLPVTLLGFRLLENGYRRIRLSPRLYGLKSADILFPTPMGDIHVTMAEGCETKIEAPDGIELVIE